MGAAAMVGLALPLQAQQGRAMTAADYARAQRAQGGAGAAAASVGGTAQATWLPDDRFWYATSSGDGSQYWLVNPARKSRAPAFNHAKVVMALAAAGGGKVEATKLSFTGVEFSSDARTVTFNDGGRRWSCDVAGNKCANIGEATAGGGAGGRGGRGFGGRGGFGGGRGGFGGRGGTSSDGHPINMAPGTTHGVFIRDFNLWLVDTATKRETQLTTDGVTDFGYATSNAGWTTSDAAFGVWSPDGNLFATNQQDERGDGKMYIVTTPLQGGHPELRAWNYPLPGDSIITTIQRVIIDVNAKRVVRLQMPPDQHRGTQTDNIRTQDLIWSPDNTQLAFISTSRDHKRETVRVADARTGAVRTVFEETSPTQYETYVNWQILWPTNEVIWYSQRDNIGRLYLYDLQTGKLKNQITQGTGNVVGITDLDPKTRTLWYTALGGEAGQNPYFRHLYRVNLDGTRHASLTPGDGDHTAQVSADKKYIVDTYSQTNVAPVTEVRDGTDGHLIMPLEKGDLTALLATGWHPVMPIRMKARDGKTDIYGLMYTPSHLDSTRKYPIINHIYPGPQTGSTSGGWGFRTSGGEPQGLAELGFVVVEIDGMGTPGRNKDFMDAYYGRMGDNTLPDQVAGMKELAQRYSWIDINRAGIYGHSGGGFATADAMFRYPDFFKAGISESGNHDNREYEDDWGERYQGLLVKNPDGTDNYTAEANQNYARNLKGHLLLAHGTMDNNVPPYNTLAVVDALIKANKDFDLLLIPNVAHGYGAASQYMQRRRWDYFVKWLLGMEPPAEYDMSSGAGGGGRGGRGGGGL
jgi:dipeptidyl aminopeptidase/acylaminoacyl peptidase